MQPPSRRLRRPGVSLLIAAALAAAPAALPAEDSPAHRHTEGQVTGPIVESPEAMKVSGVVQCFCGGCANQTIHDCTCGFAAAERARIAEALAGGATPESLIAGYVAEHGAQIRIVPERTGFNLIGWAVPWIVAAGGLVALGAVLLAWSRRASAAAPVPGAPLSAEEQRWRERVEKELKEMES